MLCSNSGGAAGYASYLQVIFAVYSEAMAENIPGHHHVRLHSVHR